MGRAEGGRRGQREGARVSFAVINCDQRSPEWYLARSGRLTGSRAHCVLAKARGGGESLQRRDLRLELACARITGLPQEDEGFISADMRRGMELEPLALAAYEVATGDLVTKTGFLACNEYQTGCSLDGHVGDFAGLVEFKCPKIATHLRYWRNPREFIEEYGAQVAHCLWVTDAAWCDLCSYDNRVPAALQLLRVRIDRASVAAYAAAAQVFLAEVTVEVQEINKLAGIA